jgi:hypothetical protein
MAGQRSARCLAAMTRARDVFAVELIIRQSYGCGSNGGQDLAPLTRVDKTPLTDSIMTVWVAAPLDRVPGLPPARECEIITVPHRADRHIQRGGQL